MPSTPPPTSLRARTPPTPLHGPQCDAYEPYSPRRSKRSTAHSNPYSSHHAERSPRAHLLPHVTTPPTTARKARFARAPTQLSSPPSSPASPASPVRARALHKTPRKRLFAAHSNGAHFDLDAPDAMLPTPSKTPAQKRQTAVWTSGARILNFQPNDPNDVMPFPQKLGKHKQQKAVHSGFELYEEEPATSRAGQIDIFMDPNARVPEMDESEDNPFVGRKRSARVPQRKSVRSSGGRVKSAEEVEREEQIDRAARNDEGVTYVFRGKKIFRRFADPDADANDDAASTSSAGGAGNPADQRLLRRKAGTAAQRPLTKSAIKPRLLFPSDEQLLERQAATVADEVDEEAITDIEMPNADDGDHLLTPMNTRFAPISPGTPPTTHRATRSSKKKQTPPTPVAFEPAPPPPDDSPVSANDEGADASASVAIPARRLRGAASASPFDLWPRSKAGRKRGGDEADGDALSPSDNDRGLNGGGKKRTKNTAGGVGGGGN